MSSPQDANLSKDCLGREVFASKMVEIIRNFKIHEKDKDSPNTLAITGPYGYGKSWLTRRIIEQLNAVNTPNNKPTLGCVYFNAWKYDYWEQPLMAIVEQLAPELINHAFSKEKKPELHARYTALKEASTKILPKVLATTAIVASAYSDFSEPAANVTPAANEKDMTRLLHCLENFGTELQNYVNSTELTTLYVFIDELDRCRPTFTIDLLEIIKHLFNIDKTVFIFSIDKYQLNAAIKHSYGHDADASAYLRRFFYSAYKLPVPIHQDYLDTSIAQDSPIYYLKSSISAVIQVVDLDPRSVSSLVYVLREACSLETFIFDQANANKATKLLGSAKAPKGTMLSYLEVAQLYILFLALRIKNHDGYFQFAKSRQTASTEGVNLDHVISEFIFKLEQMEQDVLFNSPVKLSQNTRSVLIEDKLHLANDDAKDLFTTYNTANVTKKSYFRFFYNSIEHLEYF